MASFASSTTWRAVRDRRHCCHPRRENHPHLQAHLHFRDGVTHEEAAKDGVSNEGRTELKGLFMIRGKFGSRVWKTMVLTLAGWLAGCAVGPDFKRPAAPDVSNYTATPVPGQTASASTMLGEVQRFVTGMPLEVQWWRSLKSPKLDALIETALVGSPSLASARATLRQAEELYAAQAGSTLYPQADAVSAPNANA